MDELIQKLTELFNNDDLQYKLLKARGVNLRNTVLGMIADIKQMQAGKDSGLSIRDVETSVASLKQKVLMEPNTRESLDLVKDIVLLIFNWNQNSVQSPVIEQELTTITHLVDGDLTMRDTITLLQMMGQHMDGLQSWTPPAFQISSHLFNRLQGG